VDQESDEEADKFVEDVLDIISCLYDIQDNLQSPAEDFDLEEIPQEETKLYAELALAMFPKAPAHVQQRLIRSAAKRRQRLDLSNKGSQRSRSHSSPLSLTIPGAESASNRHQFRRGFAASDDGRSMTMSHAATVFSEAVKTSVTGATSIDAFSGLLGSSPKPPKIPAELVRGRTTKCQFCGFQLPFSNHHEDEDEVRMGLEEWKEHVYLDIQPYVCTFPNCQQPQQAFGMRAEWFRHELYAHRSTDVWRCGGQQCQIDFDNEVDYEDHLRRVHIDLLHSTDLEALAKEFKNLAMTSARGNACTFCGLAIADVQKLKIHIGDHMELFALASMELMRELLGDDEDREHLLEEEIHPMIDEMIEKQELTSPDSGLGPYQSGGQLQVPGWEGDKGHMPTGTRGRGGTGVSDFDIASESSLSDGKAWLEEDNEKVQTAKSLERRDRVQSYLVKPGESDVSDEWSPDIQTIWSNMPQRNGDFVGRESDLQKVHDVLSKPGQLCILSGRGGVGKTATAAEYCFKHEKHYRYIFWVEAENAGSCAEKFALIAGQLCQVDVTKHSQAALIGMVQEQLSRSNLRWLLVFDNVEFMSGLDPFLPRKLGRSQGSVLVTTRENDLPDKSLKPFTEVRLKELSMDDSTHLLLKSMQSDAKGDLKFDPQQHPEYDDAVEASRLVGRLPLAISMVAGYVKASRANLDMFISIWEEQEVRHDQPDAQSPRSLAGGIDASIDTLWDIGISELMMKARNFLDIMSFLNPEAIPKDLLVSDHQNQSLDFPNPREKTRYVLLC
jgi:hypothetical protein